MALATAALVAVGGAGSARSDAGASQHFTVAFYQQSGLPANVDSIIQAAGGTIVERLPEIGGVGVESSNPNFAHDVVQDNSVRSAGVSATTSVIDPVATDAENNGGNTTPTGTDTEAMPDSLGFEQWDKKIMNASLDGSYAIQRGRRDVRVFVIDTGADQNHVDVAPNLDVADSRSFVPTEPTIQDFNGHGTWTISAVGAPINGVGISGVAPNVTLVEGKVLSGAGRGLFL